MDRVPILRLISDFCRRRAGGPGGGWRTSRRGCGDRLRGARAPHGRDPGRDGVKRYKDIA
ncbi:MAG: hypothetical protein WBN94_01895 [Methanothrix sp.]